VLLGFNVKVESILVARMRGSVACTSQPPDRRERQSGPNAGLRRIKGAFVS